MPHPDTWIKTDNNGLYCIPGDFYIDPMNPVTHAIITHGHADHARAGHEHVLTTKETLAIMQTRYGINCANSSQALPYREPLRIRDTTVTLLPAGHILGSAQVMIEYQHSRIIISGDYKRKVDPTCEAFEVKNCDVFISEATFGLPVFKHPEIKTEIKKLLDSIKKNPESCHLIGAYALGKCQRLIMTLRELNYHETIYLHGAQNKLCQLYLSLGIDLGSLKLVSEVEKSELQGKIVLCPPSALHDRWSRKLPNVITCLASGWMRIRARAKQKGIDLPLVISDHADWDELLQTFNEVAAPEIWITHGNEEALIYQATQLGFKARALSLIGYDENED